MYRSAGVLMPIFSLSGPYGIGTMGKEAYNFVDFLYRGKQKYWQVLPLSPITNGNSPYSSPCTYAGNPLLIDLDLLREDGLLDISEYNNIDFGANEERVDYDILNDKKTRILKLAASRFYDLLNDNKCKDKNEYNDFVKANKFFIDDYAIYQVLKEKNDGKEWVDWDDKYKYRDKDSLKAFYNKNKKDIEVYKIIQYLFYKQYFRLKSYANEKNIKIIGDIPIYVSFYSVEVWTNTRLFLLEKDLSLKEVSGCPPDAYCPDGQVWNNPLYIYNEMKKDNYTWWVDRMAYMSILYDVIRIDHFRGFESYYSIDGKTKDARNGKWIKGPGMDLLSIVNDKIGSDKIIAEDLGTITDEVKNLLKEAGYPGMKVLLFGFNRYDYDNMYRPHNYEKKSVAYIGTHDNDTLMGWIKDYNKDDVNFFKDYMHINPNEYINTQVMRVMYMSDANLVILTIQDILGLDNTARMNVPGSVSKDNWSWRLKKGILNDGSADFLAYLSTLYGRG